MENALEPYREKRPWGDYERFTLNELSTVKILTVNPGQVLSLQRHEHRDEFWKILSGSGFVVLGEERREARAGDEFFAPRGTNHRLEAGEEGLSFLEVSLGEFDEKDEVRLEDEYGRA